MLQDRNKPLRRSREGRAGGKLRPSGNLRPFAETRDLATCKPKIPMQVAAVEERAGPGYRRASPSPRNSSSPSTPTQDAFVVTRIAQGFAHALLGCFSASLSQQGTNPSLLTSSTSPAASRDLHGGRGWQGSPVLLLPASPPLPVHLRGGKSAPAEPCLVFHD